MFNKETASDKNVPFPVMEAAFACAMIFFVDTSAFAVPQAATDRSGSRGKHGATGKLSSTAGATMQAVSGGKTVGQCPLQHTSINARVSGFSVEVELKQTYKNPFKNAIETVYTFPLPHRCAIDEIVLQTGSRVVTGTIKGRNAAAQIYSASRAQGYSAALVTEERPNFFTCRVANIQPLSTVVTTIKYCEPLRVAEGKCSLVFPVVVSPRYIPGNSLARVSSEDPGVAAATDRVPDASAIAPVSFKPLDTKTYGLSLEATVQWPGDIKQVSCNLIDAKIRKVSPSSVAISYSSPNFPNRDITVVWHADAQHLPGSQAYFNGRQGFATALLPAPPPSPSAGAAKPQEYIFIIDRSSNQAKTSLPAAKEVVAKMIDSLQPGHNFQVIAFSALPSGLFPRLEAATAANKQKARLFINGLKMSEGEDVIDAIAKACRYKVLPDRARAVILVSDGNVGNDFEILEALKQLRAQSRWFVIGTGYSANRFLLEEIARAGDGRFLYLGEFASPPAAASKMLSLLQPAAATEMKIATQGLELSEKIKEKTLRFWCDSPALLFGKFKTGGPSLIRVKGSGPGQEHVSLLMLPKEEGKNRVAEKLWAMNAAYEMMEDHWIGLQYGRFNRREELSDLAEDHQIVTPVSALVAVDGLHQSVTGKVQAIHVPVVIPEGVVYKPPAPAPE